MAAKSIDVFAEQRFGDGCAQPGSSEVQVPRSRSQTMSTAVAICASTLIFLSLPAAAEVRLFQDVDKVMRNVERSLCRKYPSSKCKPYRPRETARRAKTKKPENAGLKQNPPAVVSKAQPEPTMVDAALKIKKPVVPAAVQASASATVGTGPATEIKSVLPTEKPIKKSKKDVVQSTKIVIPKLKPAAAMSIAESNDKEKTDQVAAASKSAKQAVVRKPVATTDVALLIPPKQAIASPSTSEAGACLDALAEAGVSFAPAAVSASNDQCIVPNPVKINSVKTDAGVLKFPDQPILACAFALKFSTWSSRAATKYQIASIWTGPGFDCRGRNGDSSAKISEHGLGNAVDIERIKFVKAGVIQVADALEPAVAGFEIFKSLRADACETFTTVLGPGANGSHAGHFHFDMAHRKGGYVICQ